MREMPGYADRTVSALTYLSAGIVGVIWMVICTVKRSYPSRFVMFHVMQSIFLSLCYIIINYLFWMIVNLLSHIPYLNRLIRQIIYIFNMPAMFGYSIMQCLIYGTIIYLAVFAAMGLYSYLPVVSNIIKSNFRD